MSVDPEALKELKTRAISQGDMVTYRDAEEALLGDTAAQQRCLSLISMTKRYVCGFLFVDDQVALIEKIKPDWQKGLLNGIGGKIEHGETSIQAMVREFQEEAALQTSPEDWTHFCTLKNDIVGYNIEFFFARSHTKEGIRPLTQEKVQWCDSYGLPDTVIHNLRWLIPLALDSVSKPIIITDFGDH